VAATLSDYNMQLRHIGRTKRIVCPTNPTVGRATALLSNYVPAPLQIDTRFGARYVICFNAHDAM